MILLVISLILGFTLALVSYCLIDFQVILMLAESRPNIMNLMALSKFGDTNRLFLALLLMFVVLGFLVIQMYLLSKKELNNRWLWRSAIIVILLATISYPFLSRDFYTYLFSAKMFLFYHVNPYIFPPSIFLGKDLFLDIVNNVQNTYAYGPVYLGYSLIPLLIFGAQRFISMFIGLKILNGIIFLLTGWLMTKLSKDPSKVFVFWFFNPLVLIELLVNGHNDLLMIFLFVSGIYLIKEKRNILGLGALLGSVLTKYVSVILVPLVIFSEKSRKIVAKLFLVLLLLYLIFIQRLTWYFTWIFMLIPLIEIKNKKTWVSLCLFQALALYGYWEYMMIKAWTPPPYWSIIRLYFYLVPFLFIIWEIIPNIYLSKKNLYGSVNKLKNLFKKE